MDRIQLEYLIEGLILFGLSERQVLGVLNILPTEELREELISWLVEVSKNPEGIGPSEIIMKAMEIEEASSPSETMTTSPTRAGRW